MKAAITPELAARLVAAQFPEWADLPVAPVALDGWDNTTFRIGAELSVRLPSADAYAAQVEKEHRWLPVLAPRLPLRIPESIALGRATPEFPRPWSVRRWIPGDPATVHNAGDLTAFAADLAAFLVALYTIDATAGPPPGPHNFFRGGPLAIYDAETRAALELLAADIDGAAATAVWEAALETIWDRPPVWVHGDVAPSNLLVAEGALHAVIDFGCAGVGDPACDLVVAWTFFAGESRHAFRAGLTLDDATWARARGWALWKALVTLTHEQQHGLDAAAAAHRFGWTTSAPGVIDRVLADA